MGYNTGVIILNDAMDQLIKDPNVGSNIYNAILLSQRPEYCETGLDFAIGNHINGGAVLPSQHADQVQIIAVGGNYMRKLGTVWNGWRNMQDSVALTKDLADSLGYRLVKKNPK